MSRKIIELLGPDTPLNPPKLRACRHCATLSVNYFLCPPCMEMAEEDILHTKPVTQRLCTFEACGGRHFIKGLCQAHHEQKLAGCVLRPVKRRAA